MREIQAKSILQKSGLPGADYVINPYTGCVHGCVYCYARFMKRFTNHAEPWGSFLDAKVNAPELLARRLAHRRLPLTDCVLLSSVTDPYQPPEKKYELTRRILEVLARHDAPISILTKSDLVLRDADILARLSDAGVGMSFGVADDAWSLRLEPRASPPSRRLAALRALRDRGIRVNAFVSPFLPGVSDIRQIVDALAGVVDAFAVEAINTQAGTWAATLAVIARRDRSLAKECNRLACDPQYWRALEMQARMLAAQAGMELTGFFHHRDLTGRLNVSPETPKA
ncbi:MAG: radical SAM protein [Anaerolineales bacterium]|nr:radical SAM protein [Anaerolineales bacterium]